LTVAVDPIR